MATDPSTAQFVLDQLRDAGDVRVRRMFGEYALYCDSKVVALLCDDQVYVKYTDAGRVFAEGRYTEGYAYPGAKSSMNVTDALDDRVFFTALIRLTADALPALKPKRKRALTGIKR